MEEAEEPGLAPDTGHWLASCTGGSENIDTSMGKAAQNQGKSMFENEEREVVACLVRDVVMKRSFGCLGGSEGIRLLNRNLCGSQMLSNMMGANG